MWGILTSSRKVDLKKKNLKEIIREEGGGILKYLMKIDENNLV